MRTARRGACCSGVVYGENSAAVALYARRGFCQAGVRKFQVGANTYDDPVLAKPL